MAIELSVLQDYAKLYPELFTKHIYRPSVLQFFQLHEGVDPGKIIIPLYNDDTNLHDCCSTPDDTDTIDTKEIVAACIQARKEYCETDLAKILRDGTMRFTAGQESAGELARIISEQSMYSVQRKIDRLVFNGDVDSSDQNLNKLDGLVKQATEATDSVKLNITTGNIWSAIYSVVKAIPTGAYDLGNVIVFVPKEVESVWQMTLIERNLYNYNPSNISVTDGYTRQYVPGFGNITIVGVQGLKGQIIATPEANLHALVSRQGDNTTYKWGYNEYHERYYWYLKFVLGVTFGLTEYVVVADVSEDVINAAIGLPVSIVSPLGTGGGVLTETA